MASARTTGLIGMTGVALFAVSLAVFGALNPGYSHLTNAVSELGAVGAPNQLAWNLMGFLGVGLLLCTFGRGLGRVLGTASAGWLLVLFGLSFAATAIPADMGDLGAQTSVAHIAASQAVLLFWLLALIRLMFVRSFGLTLRLVTGLALLLAIGTVVVRGAELLPPGLTQRLSFAVVLGWVLAVSAALFRRAP
ncbi:MAG: DUF998 domain-containing protein [Caulobacteraceae bacterium]|jgi:hypothetical membrane protein|nr:DUF998 domain-containing protein [Caulobacteraceae bacterium]